MITTKHHEGYTLWPSNVSWNWNSVDVGPAKNLVGTAHFNRAFFNRLLADIRKAILDQGGIRFGVYYSLFAFFHALWVQDHYTNGTQYVEVAFMFSKNAIPKANRFAPTLRLGKYFLAGYRLVGRSLGSGL